MSEPKELWRKWVGGVLFIATEKNGIETIEGQLTFLFRQNISLLEVRTSITDLEAYVRQKILDMLDTHIDGMVEQFHREIHS